jgi:hypothetical protein
VRALLHLLAIQKVNTTSSGELQYFFCCAIDMHFLLESAQKWALSIPD